MDRERRLGALVVVRRLLAEPVTAAAGREVVQRLVEPVAAEEPVERPLRTQTVLGVAGDGERGQLRRDEGGGVERLLVARPRGRARVRWRPRCPVSRSVPSTRPDSSPSQRSAFRPVSVRSSRPSAAPPTMSACGRRALSYVSESSNQCQSAVACVSYAAASWSTRRLEQLAGGRLKPVRVEPAQVRARCRRRCAARRRLRACRRCRRAVGGSGRRRREPTPSRGCLRAPRPNGRRGRRGAARRASGGRSP